MLSERVKAGLRRTKEQGKALGRPVKVANIEALLKARRDGKTIRQLSVEHQLSVGKVHSLLKGAANAHPR